MPEFERQLRYSYGLQREDVRPQYGDIGKPTDDEERANLVSSEVKGLADIHAPVIDIDLPCRLVPSSTPGHFHLYIDHLISWQRYQALLDAFAAAGIVETGYVKAARQQGMTCVRKPGVRKPGT